MIIVEKVTMCEDHKVWNAVLDAMFKGLRQVSLVANAPDGAIRGVPRKCHSVDKHWETGHIGSSRTSIDEKLLGAEAEKSNGVGSELIVVNGLIQRHKVNVAAGKPMKVGLRELDDDGGNGRVFAHRSVGS
jgi:hypothetical protein